MHLQSSSFCPRAILVFGELAGSEGDGQRVPSNGLLSQGHGRHRGVVPKDPRPGRDAGGRQDGARGRDLGRRTHGGAEPHRYGDGGHVQFGPQPNMVLETYMAPEFGNQPPSSEGGVPILPVTYVQPEAPDTLLEALRSTSIVEEHRTLMGAVIEKIQSAKSRLTEACASLLTSFEVSAAFM